MPEFQPVEQMTYSQAVAQLEEIVRMMQSDRADIDTLTAYTRRAAELLTHCRARLTATDKELQGILAQLQTPEK